MGLSGRQPPCRGSGPARELKRNTQGERKMVRRMPGTCVSRRAGWALLAGAALAVSPADLRAQPEAVNNQTPEINRLLAKAWTDNNIKPSARCTDYEFIRRVSLDLIGRIAYPEEVKAFEADSSA